MIMSCSAEKVYYARLWTQWETNPGSKSAAEWGRIYTAYKAWRNTPCGKKYARTTRRG